MTTQGIRTAGFAIAGVLTAAAVSIASCAQTPPNVTAHTFRQAQKIDLVCMQVNDANGNAIKAPVPVAQAQCPPVPLNVNGATLAFHLYAVVTQTTPGELAVVDLTAGNVVDVDKSTPGVNFIPVGANPTDVAVAPFDAPYTFVSSRDPNKMAIYAIDNRRLLGNSTGTMPPAPLTLSDLMACALPQPPIALAVVPAAPPGGGAANAYAIVALLGASGSAPAAVLTLDPAALTSAQPGSLAPCTALSGAVLASKALSGTFPSSTAPGPAWPDGVPYADAGSPTPLPQCPSDFVSAPSVDGASPADSAAPDGGADDSALPPVALTDAGGFVTSTTAALPPQPPHPTSMALRNDLPILYVADQAVPIIHVIDLHDPANPIELDPLVATSLLEPARLVAVGAIAISPTTHDYKTYLYAVDASQGTLMVYDITDPATSPRSPLARPHPELNPLALPDRISFSAPVAAVAFVQHDWSLPSPLTAPADPVHQYTGLICNPNPNAHPDAGAFVDLGAYYRADQTPRIQPSDTQGMTVQTLPMRLRGIFGFATLSDGNVVTIDVDDWDAPCRRPDPMAVGVVTDPSSAATYDAGVTGVLDIPQPTPSAGDLDPYHAPITYNSAIPESAAVSLEAFFPVSAPHRLRSNELLRDDPTAGVHVPNLIGVPQLFNASGAPVSTSGAAAATNPLLLPAPLPEGFIDPTYVQNPTEPNPSSRTVSSPLLASASLPGQSIPSVLFPSVSAVNTPGVRVSFDDPTVHQDQDWTVTYEGALPTVGGLAVTIESTQPESARDAYQSLRLSEPGAGFCARGIEDWTIGQTRASQLLGAVDETKLPAPPAFVFTQAQPPPLAPLPQWTSDYVELADDLLASNDRYWTQSSSVNACWDGALQNDADPNVASNRYTACLQTFGTADTADTFLARDLPIIHAHDDSLEVGRFAWYSKDPNTGNMVAEQTTNRVVVPGDPTNKPFLRLAACCFHHQATFKVRTGGEWVAVGTRVGLLHSVVKAPDAAGSCVLSCDPRNALMNARTLDVPWATWSQATNTCTPASAPTFDRDSPLAMRNPMFSIVMWGGCGKLAGYADHTLTTRDLTWKYSMRGSFAPLTTSIVNPNNGTAVSPQSMRFVGPLGQLAVVDGETQGLVLIDLNLVAVAHNYY
jgi:hypothetical protein